jgi:hypothetical protein
MVFGKWQEKKMGYSLSVICYLENIENRQGKKIEGRIWKGENPKPPVHWTKNSLEIKRERLLLRALFDCHEKIFF